MGACAPGVREGRQGAHEEGTSQAECESSPTGSELGGVTEENIIGSAREESDKRGSTAPSFHGSVRNSQHEAEEDPVVFLAGSLSGGEPEGCVRAAGEEVPLLQAADRPQI